MTNGEDNCSTSAGTTVLQSERRHWRTALTPATLDSVLSCYHHQAPLALVAATPQIRMATEIHTYQYGAQCTCMASMLSLNPTTLERTATITDMKRLEHSKWWLTRPATAGGMPLPVYSMEFCVEGALNPFIDAAVSVPLCSMTVRSVTLNICDLPPHGCAMDCGGRRGYNTVVTLASLGSLSHLQELHMGRTTVRHSHQEDLGLTPQFLDVLKRLEQLTIGDYHLVSHLPLAELRNLKEIDLSGTGVEDTTIASLAQCTLLRKVFLCGCHSDVRRFTPLSKLSLLSVLDVRGSSITDDALAAICKGCSFLSELCLRDCRLLEHFAPLRLAQRLERVDLSHTSAEVSALEALCTLPVLKYLLLRSCPGVGNDGGAVMALLSRVPELHELDCANVGLADVGVEALATCTSLRHLNIACNRLVAKVGPLVALPSLNKLDLSGTSVTSEDLELLSAGGATSITSLRLHGCQHAKELSVLTGLTQLRVLDMCDTHVDDKALSAIVSCCPDMVDLTIHFCSSITDIAPLLKLRFLRRVGLGGTRLTKESTDVVHVLSRNGVRVSCQLVLLHSSY